MDQVPALSVPRLPPASGGAAQQLVVLLHGLGADGNDLISLAPHWAPTLPDAEFVSPHALEPCDMAPMGRQWFSIQERTPEAMVEGVRRAIPHLGSFVDEELAKLGLDDNRLALVGFSQGAMMALHIGLRRLKQPGAIIGYSGRLIGPDLLEDEITVKPPILLIHGDHDEVVPVASIHEAVPVLENAGIEVEWHVCQGMGHSIDSVGLELGQKFLQRSLSLTA